MQDKKYLISNTMLAGMRDGGYYFHMKIAVERSKPKSAETAKRAPGRPKVKDPKKSATLRFDPVFLEELDAWAKDHGDMGRSAAIRLAVSYLIKGRTIEKSS